MEKKAVSAPEIKPDAKSNVARINISIIKPTLNEKSGLIMPADD